MASRQGSSVTTSARDAALQTVRRRDIRCVARLLVPQVRCSGGTVGHEPLFRSRGGNADDPNQIVLLCSAHHHWVHAHPAEALVVGLAERHQPR